MAVVEVDGHERVYAIGGQHFNDVATTFSKTMEVYNDTKGWDFVTDMVSPRTLFTATTIDGKIYAVGGFSN